MIMSSVCLSVTIALWINNTSYNKSPSLGQLSLPSLRGRLIEYRPLAGVKAGVFTCVGWQVTLCDPI